MCLKGTPKPLIDHLGIVVEAVDVTLLSWLSLIHI